MTSALTRRALVNDIVTKILTTFESLPTRYKPRRAEDGRKEWVPLAGIVVAKSTGARQTSIQKNAIDDGGKQLQCVSVATGMKCLSRDKISLVRGNVLHDWHAEVLTIRAFNRWVIDECQSLIDGGTSSWMQYDQQASQHLAQAPPTCVKPFRLQPDVEVYMYVSAAPCGDASMEVVMAAQEDSTPWTKPAPSAKPGDMIGRGHFDQLGVVRRKPSRPDAPSTWSKSCSDKLAMKQCTGLLSGIVSQLVEPIYLHALILPEDQVVETAVRRAFSADGRMAALACEDVQERWSQHGYEFRPFEIMTTGLTFTHSRSSDSSSSNLSCMWTPHRQEALVNGVLMGRKQFEERGASSVSRRRMAEAVRKLATETRSFHDRNQLQTYDEMKSLNEGNRHIVKNDTIREALHGWRPNSGDGDWKIG